MTGIYIKAHIRELDDERIVGLSSTAFRTLVLLRFLAGIEDRDGELPSFSQIAFRLRTNVAPLEADLEELRRAGLVDHEAGPWRLTSFQEEQAAVTGKERTRAWRVRHGLAPCDETSRPAQSGDETSQPPLVVVQEQEQAQEQERDKTTTRQGKTSRHGDETSPDAVVVVAALKNLNIEPRTAEELVREKGPAYVQEKIDAYLQAIKAGRVKSPGWLVGAILNDWKGTSPPDPDSDAQRQRYAKQLEQLEPARVPRLDADGKDLDAWEELPGYQAAAGGGA